MAAAAEGQSQRQLANRHVCVVERPAIRLNLGGFDTNGVVN
jgi:hypothetical protein